MALTLGLLSSACGSSGSSSGRATNLAVFAAASLSNAFPTVGREFEAGRRGVVVRFVFGGTDTLAAQIAQGAPADVFAGASARYGDQLAGKDLIDAWRAFATNKLVVIVPSSNPAGIHRLDDLTKPGLKLVLGAESVPVGGYTRTVLANLDRTVGRGFSTRVLANVVSNEDSAEGVLAKVESGEADAGFVYVTDARAGGASVLSIPLPPGAEATATYPIAVVKASPNASQAGAFVRFVLSGAGQRALAAAGFGPTPSG